MKKYTLFFTGKNQLADPEYSAEKCSSCPLVEECSLVPRDMYYASIVPSFEVSKEIIDGLYNRPDISFIFLVDGKEHVGFIYKGDGTEQELKESSHIKNALEFIEQEVSDGLKNIKKPVNIVIHDVRTTMKVHPADPSVN